MTFLRSRGGDVPEHRTFSVGELRVVPQDSRGVTPIEYLSSGSFIDRRHMSFGQESGSLWQSVMLCGFGARLSAKEVLVLKRRECPVRRVLTPNRRAMISDC